MESQAEFSFESGSSGGISKWRREQELQREELARRMGLPLGKQVEVWLHGGIRLRGSLRLAEALLLHANATLENTRFEVNAVPFSYADLESCVQMTDPAAS